MKPVIKLKLVDDLDFNVQTENKKLKKQFDIAVKALESIKHTIDDFEDDPMNKITFMAYGNLWSVRDVSKEALKQIKELK